jgi:hypothetical protein
VSENTGSRHQKAGEGGKDEQNNGKNQQENTGRLGI